jgi:putative hemolysin
VSGLYGLADALVAESVAHHVMSMINLGIPGSIVLIAVLLLFTAFFSIAEIALVSVRRTRIKQLVEEGVARAKTVQKLIEDPTRFLATIQTGVTLVGFFASAVGAVTLAKPLEGYLRQLDMPMISRHASGTAVVIVTLLLIFLNIVVGEITPKSLGLRNAEGVALRVAEPLTYISYIASWFIKLIIWTSNLLVKPFGGTATFGTPILTEEEFKMLVEAGEAEGVLEEEEKEMIHSIFEFTDTVVRKVMTPRTDIKAVEVNESVDDLIKVIIGEGHSRIPVYEDTIDNIVGIVHAKDLLRVLHENGKKKIALSDLVRKPHVIPENKMVDELLAEFKRNKVQMAIVVDEYGGTAGLVTVEDLLEEIVGDIMDEYDVEEPQIQIVDENTMIADGQTPIGDINDQMDLELPEEDFDTIGGLVFGLLGKEPAQGDDIVYESVHMIVEQTDGRRIQKVRIIKSEKTSSKRDEDDDGDENG